MSNFGVDENGSTPNIERYRCWTYRVVVLRTTHQYKYRYCTCIVYIVGVPLSLYLLCLKILCMSTVQYFCMLVSCLLVVVHDGGRRPAHAQAKWNPVEWHTYSNCSLHCQCHTTDTVNATRLAPCAAPTLLADAALHWKATTPAIKRIVLHIPPSPPAHSFVCLY